MRNLRVFRYVPEGICTRCGGMGYGEEIADLGEARSRGAHLPIKPCKSCAGTGQAAATVHITGVGLTLLFVVVTISGIAASICCK
jgi:hypothetical protein